MTLPENPYGPYVRDSVPFVIPNDEIAIFVPKHNTTKPDATGAFHPEAKRFCDHWKISHSRIFYVDNHKPKSIQRKGNVADELLCLMENVQQRQVKPVAIWVFFCHGYTHGLQFSIRSRGHRHSNDAYERRYQQFVDIISDHPSPAVALYACSTGDDPDGDKDTAPGSGDGSFADLLRDDLCAAGSVYCRVFAHTTAGHTTHNPFVKFFDGEGSAVGQTGGELIAAPGTPEFRKLRSMLRTDFKFEVPFMTKASARKALK